MQPIRCRLCGYMAICDRSREPRQASDAEVAALPERDRARALRKAELDSAGIDYADVGAEYGQECVDESHDYEDIHWGLMMVSRTAQDRVGRWPTLKELHAVLEAGRELSRQASGNVRGVMLAWEREGARMRLADWPGLDEYLPRRIR